MVELVVVIAVIVVLTSVGVVSYRSVQIDSRDTARRSSAQQIKNAIDALKLRYDTPLKVGGYNTVAPPQTPTAAGLCTYNTTTTGVSDTTANWVYVGGSGTGANYPCTFGKMLQLTGLLKPDFFATVPPNDEYATASVRPYAHMVLYRCDTEGRRWVLYYHVQKPTDKETTEMAQLHSSCSTTNPTLNALRDTLKMRAAIEITL